MRIGDAGFPDNQIQIATGAGNFPDYDSNKGLQTKRWQHVAMTYNADTREVKGVCKWHLTVAGYASS